MNKEQYPIGRFVKPKEATIQLLKKWISIIRNFPLALKKEIEGLSDEQYNLIYREGGWTIRQLIHHCADSHMNAFLRIKLALTEESPVIKPYYEDKWAELPDAKLFSVDSSMKILFGLHERWAALLDCLESDQFKKSYLHPELKTKVSIWEAVGMYAWHCSHHLEHIKIAKGKSKQ